MAEVKKVIDIIQDDIPTMRKFIKCGLMDACRLNEYAVYNFYSTLTKIESKMDRYVFTAESMGLSQSQVMRIVSKMEQEINI